MIIVLIILCISVSAFVIQMQMDDCRGVVHLCPVCQAEVGRKIHL
ncbi:unnamed protein product [Paramecium octaurelia]|uniref:LITAF domain-containing protein n=1 Tax=Paramecium octaurelia TaxID=43137 RepID=A0A8S1UG01_PAROT|nr:unnamed protein product [Paramecium octaurelia]